MDIYEFEISKEDFEWLHREYPNLGKNSDIGNYAEWIVRKFFLTNYKEVSFNFGRRGADIEISYDGKLENFEIKGTVDRSISWAKLKVSSQHCHDCLVNGMAMIRVTGIGKRYVTLYFMRHNQDFILVPEVRYAVKPAKNIVYNRLSFKEVDISQIKHVYVNFPLVIRDKGHYRK